MFWIYVPNPRSLNILVLISVMRPPGRLATPSSDTENQYFHFLSALQLSPLVSVFALSITASPSPPRYFLDHPFISLCQVISLA